MKIFVINCGSSSMKYTFFRMTDERVPAKGVFERIGTEKAQLKHTANGHSYDLEVDAPDHTTALRILLDVMVDPEKGVLEDVAEIEGIGHRVVHGGEKMTEPRIIDEEVIRVIEENFPLAPLHNPANLAGIRGAMTAAPHVTNVAAFDTSFLSTMPPKAYRYAVPESWYKKHHVRKYGFHGTSHRYVTLRAAELLGKDRSEVNLITCHLGNGCSVTAVRDGKAIDHSMGLTPLEGLMMGTRSGDLDPAVVFYMHSQGLDCDEVNETLNKKSGLLGVSGQSNDMRDLLAAAADGNEKAELAVEMFVYRVAKYIGSYRSILPDLDAVVLTGGIGENSRGVRRRLMETLSPLGAVLDEQANTSTIRGKAGAISTPESDLPVWVIGTNEELMIARETKRLVTTCRA